MSNIRFECENCNHVFDPSNTVDLPLEPPTTPGVLRCPNCNYELSRDKVEITIVDPE